MFCHQPALTASPALRPTRTGTLIAFNTPYCVGTIAAMLLNLIIPNDLPDDEDIEAEEEWARWGDRRAQPALYS
jgi:hypothetical protein